MAKFWLMKSEPDVYSILDLKRDKQTGWEGVRNYQARNSMRDDMSLGDLVLFYHSNADPSGIAGLCKIAKLAYPDPTQFDSESDYYDAGSKREAPRWLTVDVAFVEAFETTLDLSTLKADPKLCEMLVVQKGQRLSVQPVSASDFKHVLKLAKSATRI